MRIKFIYKDFYIGDWVKIKETTLNSGLPAPLNEFRGRIGRIVPGYGEHWGARVQHYARIEIGGEFIGTPAPVSELEKIYNLGGDIMKKCAREFDADQRFSFVESLGMTFVSAEKSKNYIIVTAKSHDTYIMVYDHCGHLTGNKHVDSDVDLFNINKPFPGVIKKLTYGIFAEEGNDKSVYFNLKHHDGGDMLVTANDVPILKITHDGSLQRITSHKNPLPCDDKGRIKIYE